MTPSPADALVAELRLALGLGQLRPPAQVASEIVNDEKVVVAFWSAVAAVSLGEHGGYAYRRIAEQAWVCAQVGPDLNQRLRDFLAAHTDTN